MQVERPAWVAHFNRMLKVCAVFVLICASLAAQADSAGRDSAGRDFAGRVRVIDADTWDVGRERVRLFGIDAPEMDQTCTDSQGQRWACGVWVSEQVRQRFGGQDVRCERLNKDRYGRTVARCFVDGKDVARAIVAEGLAFAYRRYSTDYVLDEKGAAVNARGLHSSQVQSPAAYRAARTSAVAPVQNRSGADCPIKGNISSKGVYIYHVPGQRDYGRTRVNTAKGERWFCSETEARSAGWRRARR